jgi:hypothetical protein
MHGREQVGKRRRGKGEEKSEKSVPGPDNDEFK